MSDIQDEFNFDDPRKPKSKRNRNEGRQRKEEGIEKVLANQHPAVIAWKEQFVSGRDALMASDQWFNAEHIRGICGDPPIEAHPNIFGAMCSTLCRISNHIGWSMSERRTSNGAALRNYKGYKRDS